MIKKRWKKIGAAANFPESYNHRGKPVENVPVNPLDSEDVEDKKNVDAEFAAMKRISHALKNLNSAEKSRVVQYYADRFVLRS